MRDPIVAALVAKYGQHSISGGDRYVPEYGLAKELPGNTAQGEEFKKKLETRVQRNAQGVEAWVTFMHAKMNSALRQSKEQGVYPECTQGRDLTTNINRVFLMERVPLCQYAWDNDMFTRATRGKQPTWE